MAVDVIVPEVGEAGMEIVFVRWLKGEGDRVTEGEGLFEVDTAKSILEVQSLGTGVLTDCRVSDGDSVEPRQVVAVLVQDGETAATAPASASAGATPSARRRARDLGVDLASVPGGGPGGIVTSGDVDSHAVKHPAGGSRQRADEADLARRARRSIAAHTQRTWQTVPHFHLTAEVDVTAALGVARPTTIVCAAAVHAFTQHPECNVVWHPDGPTSRDSIDLGLLVDTPTGLVIGRVPEADHLDLDGLGQSLRALTIRARENRLTTDDLGPRTITVSNLGMFAVDHFTGVIAAPDPMLLTVGRVRTAPRLRGDEWEAARLASLTLTVDHRALDGADGGRLLGAIEAALTQPEVLGDHA
jgi:pyruvate dehydrogenase E2 component (dihydrolipoamide acetyltransferase)